jgi:hypothetical protein
VISGKLRFNESSSNPKRTKDLDGLICWAREKNEIKSKIYLNLIESVLILIRL